MKLRNTFYKGNKIWWLLYVVFISMDGLVSLAISVALQQITDAAVNQDMKLLIKMCMVCTVGVAVMVGIMWMQYLASATFVKRAMTQYKNTVFEQLLKKNRRSFSNENTSVYISALTNDAVSIETDYLRGTVNMISHCIAFVATLVAMLLYSPILTVAAVGLTLLPIVISILSGGKLAEAEKTVSKQNADFVGTIKDMLSGFPVIKSFRAEHEIETIYQKDNGKLEQEKFHKHMVKGRIGVLSEVGTLISQFGVFFVGGFLVIAGKGVTVGVLMAFINMLGALVMPINAVPQLLAARKAALALIDKMETILNENVSDSGGEKVRTLEKEIAVKQVSFGYTKESDVLQDISVKFEAGKSYALVGGSGSGKSTLLDLVMGSFGDYRGEICFDGKELKRIQVESLYDMISVIQQNVFIFDATILENITMFKEFPAAQVQRAIALSGLKKLIEEKGEDYLCGENGCNLSGGERQRISIARCLLRDTPVLVADEATAALDAKTAYDVVDAILDMDELTRIIVTHQLEEVLLSRYDEIIVMKNGQIAECGSFAELLDKKGYFYSLYNVAV